MLLLQGCEHVARRCCPCGVVYDIADGDAACEKTSPLASSCRETGLLRLLEMLKVNMLPPVGVKSGLRNYKIEDSQERYNVT
ncbi:hypothetical protein CEXT_64311 [Caerostris extrusa]|uniref:Uncharacterized protein n=1 Tax=Caerostris extrusa TaxID=172846 RepID=A0AAV4N126_CAEEX|nr:hypothetical protein CEXT_64311 [Caerostris extrusa]